MQIYKLLARNLRCYWRTNVAVLLGVATASGVIGGAALVGESVRASLREIALRRLGNVDSMVSRNGFMREKLASAFPQSAPAIVMDGTLSRATGDRHVATVQVYGVDQRFWTLQGIAGEAPTGRDVILTTAVARELSAKPGDTVLLRVRKPSAIPLESIHGRKDDVGKTLRLNVAKSPGLNFSLQAQQGELRAVYVPLARLQQDLDQPGKVNSILLGSRNRSATGDPLATFKANTALADLGISLRPLEDPAALSLESESAIISDALAHTATEAARALGLHARPVLSYLANGIRLQCSHPLQPCPTVPYSIVTAIDSELAPSREDGIVLNEWTARDLRAKPGDFVNLDYFVWKSEGQLTTESARFRIERVVPLTGAAADRNLTPEYPGITEAESLQDWDPPFPLDLKRIRQADELYWKQYRTTPKAFIRLERGKQLWGTRFGSLSSIRISPPRGEYETQLRTALDPAAMGISVVSLRSRSLAAAQGATDFDEYFFYFSFFLVISALLLTGLFFRLGIEQRTREIGVLQSLGFPAGKIRSLFLLEGAALALAGGVGGVLIALGYGALILLGLRTWWIGAVRTQMLSLHASLPALGVGAGGGVLAGLLAVALTLRSLRVVTPRGLLSGQRRHRRTGWRWAASALAFLIAAALGCCAFIRSVDETTGFFGAGTLLLLAALLFLSACLEKSQWIHVTGKTSLGLRSMARRPGRSVLCITLIASATFTIVSLDAFRRDGSSGDLSGYPLLATSNLPLIYDPNTTEGRNALNLVTDAPEVEFVPFRVRAGDDASCLNLYRPLNPRIMAPPSSFLREAGFAFQQTARETANPWMLLEQTLPDGAIPAIADANSMAYAMHLKLGEAFRLNGVQYRIVAALRDSIFQGELLISEANFKRLFPEVEGARFFLVKTTPAQAEKAARDLEDSLSDFGFGVQRSAARLADFHQVENTYLSTFRALGGLGLILSTVGLAAVLLRNVLERRRELALLRAVGYRPEDLAAIVLIENISVLILGLATGAVCALLAIFPAASARGGHVPVASLVTLLGTVLLTGTAASLLATVLALRSPLLEAIRSE